MKKMKKYSILVSILLFIYVFTLSIISVKMNNHPYRIFTSASQVSYEVSSKDANRELFVPITIKNKSNRLISSRNNINIGYHLYGVDENKEQKLIAWDNQLSNIEDIFNNEEGTCNVTLNIPDEAGVYIYYIDVLESNTQWFSEKGVLTIPVTVEVK
ncbi:hypothetical protein ACOAOT_18250 [Lacrimispora sp. AGF001]|uniref:hypothetical protein n=1 Tax=Lacrimispora sp. AGF001 TaxID=3401631 RepID=UPI003B4311CF